MGDVFHVGLQRLLTIRRFCRDLTRNRLTGTIPSTVGQLSFLSFL
jgi:hypothetical protein